MTKEETREILTKLKAAFPHSFRNMSREDMVAMFDLWTDELSGESQTVVAEAVSRAISTMKWVPTLAELKKLMPTNAETGVYLDVEEMRKIIKNELDMWRADNHLRHLSDQEVWAELKRRHEVFMHDSEKPA